MREFFKKYTKWLLIIFLGGILTTWIWFTNDGGFSTGGMEKSAWLSFWGGFLAFFGTVFLGLVAIWQNEKIREQANSENTELKRLNEQANSISEKMMRLQETEQKLLNRPFILPTNNTAFFIDRNRVELNQDLGGLYVAVGPTNDAEVFCISLTLVNSTQSLITANYQSTKCRENNENWQYGISNNNIDKLTIPPSGAKDIFLYADKSFFDSFKGSTLIMSFILENRFSNRYREQFDMKILFISKDNVNDKWLVEMFFQDFKLFRFEKRNEHQVVEIPEEL